MDNRLNLNKELAIYNEQLQKAHNTKICSVPNDLKSDCKGNKIINAHTISKCLGLKEISINGKIMGLEKLNLHNFHVKQGILDFSEIGVQQASVLSCFCSFHDQKLFSDIETAPFSANSKQCFLLAYRALISEWYRASHDSTEKILLDRAEKECFSSPNIPDFLLSQKQELLESWIESEKLDKHFSQSIKRLRYKKRDLDIEKCKYDEILLNSEFSKMNHYIFEPLYF